MFRHLLVVAALALPGCATYGPAHYGDRAPVYRDGSYYSPSASGYGDYYYAPEYRYDDYDYYDRFGYGYGYGHGYGYGGFGSRYGYGYGCGLRYRPCFRSGYWGSGFGLSLFFGNGWNRWHHWPYYGGWHRDRRDRDDSRARDPRLSPPVDGDRNRRQPAPAEGSIAMPRDARQPEVRAPWVRDPNRYRDDRGQLPPPRDRNVRGGSGDPNVNARPMPRAQDYVARPAPPPPREEAPREHREERRAAPRRERSSEGGENRDRNVRRDGGRRPA